MGSTIAVSGAVGGIGASTLAYAIALRAAPTAVLIDARTSGVPLDILIGGESEPGTRWHQIHVANAAIDASAIREALPRWQNVHFLSASRSGTAHLPALSHLVTALRSTFDYVVVDVDARSPLLEGTNPDCHVLAMPNTIYGLGAAVPSVREHTKLVVMKTAIEDFRATETSRYLPQPVIGVVEQERSVWMALRARSGIPMNTSVMRIADQIIAGVADAA